MLGFALGAAAAKAVDPFAFGTAPRGPAFGLALAAFRTAGFLVLALARGDFRLAMVNEMVEG